MRRIILFVVALVFSMATCSQSRSAPAGQQIVPLEKKQSVFFGDDNTLDEYTLSNWSKDLPRIDNTKRYSASETMLEQVEFKYYMQTNTRGDYKDELSTKIYRDVEERMQNRITYKYTSEGYLKSETLQNGKGILLSNLEYTYDRNGNRISRVISGRGGAKQAETVYTFDTQGKMLTSQTNDVGGNPVSTTRYSYDRDGKLVGQQVLDNEGKVTSVTTAVWREGREISETKGPDGIVQMRITNEYGVNGELVKKTIENFQGESKQITVYEYELRSIRRQS